MINLSISMSLLDSGLAVTVPAIEWRKANHVRGSMRYKIGIVTFTDDRLMTEVDGIGAASVDRTVVFVNSFDRDSPIRMSSTDGNVSFESRVCIPLRSCAIKGSDARKWLDDVCSYTAETLKADWRAMGSWQITMNSAFMPAPDGSSAVGPMVEVTDMADKRRICGIFAGYDREKDEIRISATGVPTGRLFDMSKMAVNMCSERILKEVLRESFVDGRLPKSLNKVPVR